LRKKTPKISGERLNRCSRKKDHRWMGNFKAGVEGEIAMTLRAGGVITTFAMAIIFREISVHRNRFGVGKEDRNLFGGAGMPIKPTSHDSRTKKRGGDEIPDQWMLLKSVQVEKRGFGTSEPCRKKMGGQFAWEN